MADPSLADLQASIQGIKDYSSAVADSLGSVDTQDNQLNQILGKIVANSSGGSADVSAALQDIIDAINAKPSA